MLWIVHCKHHLSGKLCSCRAVLVEQRACWLNERRHCDPAQLTLSDDHYTYVAPHVSAPFNARVAMAGKDVQARFAMATAAYPGVRTRVACWHASPDRVTGSTGAVQQQRYI